MQEWGIAALLLNLETVEMSGQLHVLTALSLGEKSPWYQSIRKLGRHRASPEVALSMCRLKYPDTLLT